MLMGPDDQVCSHSFYGTNHILLQFFPNVLVNSKKWKRDENQLKLIVAIENMKRCHCYFLEKHLDCSKTPQLLEYIEVQSRIWSQSNQFI